MELWRKREKCEITQTHFPLQFFKNSYPSKWVCLLLLGNYICLAHILDVSGSYTWCLQYQSAERKIVGKKGTTRYVQTFDWQSTSDEGNIARVISIKHWAKCESQKMHQHGQLVSFCWKQCGTLPAAHEWLLSAATAEQKTAAYNVLHTQQGELFVSWDACL